MRRSYLKIIASWAIMPVFLIFLSACGKKEASAPPPPPKVAVTRPMKQTVTDYLTATGNTQAINTVQLTARVSGYLEKVFFNDGQMVKKGQLLFLIQQDTYQNELQQSEAQIALYKAQLDYAQRQFIRYSNLVRENAASKSDVDNWRYQRNSAEANLKSAVAARDLARLNLDYTRVIAPFDGRMDRRLQDPGNLVGSSSSNTDLAGINQMDPIYVYFTISDSDLARLMKNTNWLPGRSNAGKLPVFAGMTGEEGYPHTGSLDFASNSLSSNTGTLLMRGIFPNADGRILPGLFARVRLPIEKKELFVIPAKAVGDDQQGRYVLVVNEKNIVERRGVSLGPMIGNQMRAITGGLTGKERIVVEGLLKAVPGRPVSPQRKSFPPIAAPPQPGGEVKASQ
jgi:RND family efflux transporter MFP subunit